MLRKLAGKKGLVAGVFLCLVIVGLILAVLWVSYKENEIPPPSLPCAHPQVDAAPGNLVSSTKAPGQTGQSGRKPENSLPQGLPAIAPLEQVGFGMSIKANIDTWAPLLGAKWYLSWDVETKPTQSAAEHWQMVRLGSGCVYPSREWIQWTARHYRGKVWIIGNEPDVKWQDDIPAEEYASAYHDLYTLIKRADPSALVAVGGISQATPLRLRYLDRVVEFYKRTYGKPMPVDWWTVHGFVLREERGSWGVDIPAGFSDDQGLLYEVSDHGRLDYFQAHILAFREWMDANGYRNKPLALTEFGILMPVEYDFPLEMVAQYLQDTFAWLAEVRSTETGYPADANRLVQRWAWFSLSDPIYPTSNLVDLEGGQLTVVGEAMRLFVQRRAGN